MGLLDTIKAIFGQRATGSIQLDTLQSMLEGVFGKNNPQLNKILKNIDLSQANEILEFFKKNGIPDTKEEITELISKLNKTGK